MTLSIIIVNYNVYDDLINCLNSINKNICDVEYKIIVVDNNSTNRDIDKITFDYPDVIYIKLPENLGFAKANNLAVSRSNSEFILFLNPDTILINNFVLKMVEYLKNNINAGACAPMLLNEDFSYQSSTGPKMGLKYDFLEAFHLINFSRKFQKNNYIKNIDNIFEIGWMSAACMVIKREVFNKVNGFSEPYFLNYEDIDICYKLNKLGLKNYYFPEYKCVHLDHKSFGIDYELLVYSRYLSRLEFAKMNYNYFQRIIFRTLHIIGLITRIVMVHLLYSGIERASRRSGYVKSIKRYLCSK